MIGRLYLLTGPLCGCRSELVATLLQRSGLSYTHLSAPTPADYKLQPSQPHWKLPRGVMQRNTGLAWLRSHLDTAPSSHHGVLYFADDDNTYDLRIFEEVSVDDVTGFYCIQLASCLMICIVGGHTSRICNLTLLLISWVRSFI